MMHSTTQELHLNKPVIEAITPSIDFAQLEELSLAATSMVQLVRAQMLAPERSKKPPILTSNDVCEIGGIEITRFRYLYKKHEELPRGNIVGAKREFTVEEFQTWMRFIRAERMRDASKCAAVTIAVTNFKGGVTKTTTAATLAHGLSLRGHRVLLVDLDPQGSLSTLFDILPDLDVEVDKTVTPIYSGDATDIMPSVQQTYWHGIDLVAASPSLHNSEFMLPARQRSEAGFQFWRCLDAAMDTARDAYDVIILDSPPSLSYTTINALMAADGLLMPLPPSALDFASSAQFWSLLVDLITGLPEQDGGKKFSFIDVLLSKVDPSVGVTSSVREWIVNAYGAKVMPIEIPKTSIADTASAAFGTVYDLPPGSVAAKTLRRAKLAYEEMVSHVEKQIEGVWLSQAQNAGGQA